MNEWSSLYSSAPLKIRRYIPRLLSRGSGSRFSSANSIRLCHQSTLWLLQVEGPHVGIHWHLRGRIPSLFQCQVLYQREQKVCMEMWCTTRNGVSPVQRRVKTWALKSQDIMYDIYYLWLVSERCCPEEAMPPGTGAISQLLFVLRRLSHAQSSLSADQWHHKKRRKDQGSAKKVARGMNQQHTPRSIKC